MCSFVVFHFLDRFQTSKNLWRVLKRQVRNMRRKMTRPLDRCHLQQDIILCPSLNDTMFTNAIEKTLYWTFLSFIGSQSCMVADDLHVSWRLKYWRPCLLFFFAHYFFSDKKKALILSVFHVFIISVITCNEDAFSAWKFKKYLVPVIKSSMWIYSNIFFLGKSEDLAVWSKEIQVVRCNQSQPGTVIILPWVLGGGSVVDGGSDRLVLLKPSN